MSINCKYVDTPMRFRLDTSQKYKSLTLTLVSGCVNYFNIIEPLNTFRFLENAAFIIVSITPGNYTMTTLCAAVQAAVNVAAPVNTYSITYDTATKLTTFTRTAGADAYCVAPVLGEPLPTIDVKLGYKYNITAAHTADVGINNYNIVSFNLELRIRGPNFASCGVHESESFVSRLSNVWSIPIPVTEIYGGNLLFENRSFMNHTMIFPKRQTVPQLELFLVDPLNDFANIDNHGSEIYVNFRMSV